MQDTKQVIRDKARAIGFEAVGFCAAEAAEADQRHLAEFLSRGLHEIGRAHV